MNRLRMLATGLTALFAILALSATPAFGQATAGEITGRVLDSAGAAIPGALVTARNEGTGLVRTVTTTTFGSVLS